MGAQNSVTIADAGQEYVISGIHPISAPEDLPLSVGYPYLAYENAQPAPVGISPEPYPYKLEKAKEERREKYFEGEKNNKAKLRRRKRNTGEDLAAEPPRPDRRHNLAKAINSLRSGSEIWNDLARAIQEKLAGKDKRAFARDVVSRLQSSLTVLAAGNALPVSVLQSFLPIAGKGTNRSKPDGAKLDNLKEPWADWFEEWCRYRGVWYVLNARFAGDKQKDVKFAALLPGTQISLAAMRTIADQFVQEDWIATGRAYSNIKGDVFTLLGLARWLVGHSEFAPAPENRLYRFLKARQPGLPRPRDVIAGLSTAYFKSLGSGRALANTSSLLLPDWFPITPSTYNSWLAVLDEHCNVLSYLDEKKSEEAELLRKYRDALSSNDLGRYLEFFAEFGEQFIRRRGRDLYTEQFTRSHSEVLIMGLSSELNPNIALLIKDGAFLALADAVHEATVKAQYWKGQNQQEYEIHYGLAHEWKRAADRGLEFIQVLSDFVRAYNEENAKKKEKSNFSRDDVARADLDRFLEYLTAQRVDSRTACLLLLAYGFAMTDDERERAQAARDKKQTAQTTV
jgi:hypothetical protein